MCKIFVPFSDFMTLISIISMLSKISCYIMLSHRLLCWGNDFCTYIKLHIKWTFLCSGERNKVKHTYCMCKSLSNTVTYWFYYHADTKNICKLSFTFIFYFETISLVRSWSQSILYINIHIFTISIQFFVIYSLYKYI